MPRTTRPPTASSFSDCCKHNGMNGRKNVCSTASSRRDCRNSGPWSRFLSRSSRASRVARSTRKLIKRLARVDALLIDELGYVNVRPEQTNIFFKLMEERYSRKATILTTNLDYNQWHNILANKDLVNAMLSRLRHRCHTI